MEYKSVIQGHFKMGKTAEHAVQVDLCYPDNLSRMLQASSLFVCNFINSLKYLKQLFLEQKNTRCCDPLQSNRSRNDPSDRKFTFFLVNLNLKRIKSSSLT